MPPVMAASAKEVTALQHYKLLFLSVSPSISNLYLLSQGLKKDTTLKASTTSAAKNGSQKTPKSSTSFTTSVSDKQKPRLAVYHRTRPCLSYGITGRSTRPHRVLCPLGIKMMVTDCLSSSRSITDTELTTAITSALS